MSAAKPSLFNRPAWAAKSTPTTDVAEKPVFGQHRVYDEIIAEEARKREAREARRKAKAEKAAAKVQNEVGEPVTKKRRLTGEAPDEPGDSDTGLSIPSSPRNDTPEPVTRKRLTRAAQSTEDKLLTGLDDPQRHSVTTPKKPTVINLEDDNDSIDGNQGAYTANAQTTPSKESLRSQQAVKPPPPPPPLDEDEDPFIRELQRKAREKARQQETERNRAIKSTSPTRAGSARSPSFDQGPNTPQSPVSTRTGATPDSSGGSIQAEPNVAILIKTHIPGTKDLVVNRHASQSLLHVKNYWCARHKLEPSFAQQVFFTWRGTRLYNSSTMTSLINILKKEQGIPLSSDEDPSNGRIQVDAVTQEILQEQQKAREAAQRAAEGTHEEEQPPPTPKKEGIILLLKCKGVEPMPLRVRPNTSVAKIMRAFHSQRSIDKTKTCYLVFDGERLDEAMTVESVGFEDEDEVEVHPR